MTRPICTSSAFRILKFGKYGVGTGCVAYGGERLGVFYLEKGASQRPSKIVYDRKYTALPRFPATSRDLAFVCDIDIPVLKIEKLIAEAVGKILESIKLFDVYVGPPILPGMKSVAFSIKMRAADRTLTDEEADAAMKRAIKALDKIGISLRS